MRKRLKKIKNDKSFNEFLNEYAEAVLEIRNCCDEAYRLLYKAQGKHYYTEADIFPDIFNADTQKKEIIREVKKKIYEVSDAHGIKIGLLAE